ncbi:MAG: ferredoxin-thioredoxin reductase catalytic domain-containing protein [Candidatus Helarchaeota archaeon]
MVSIDDFKKLIEQNAKNNGWILNEDDAWLTELIGYLWENKQRYGYPSCPCRLAKGEFEKDKDIICPCEYAAPDIEEFGHCYCALFFKKDFFKEGKSFRKIPERRPESKI